MTDTLDTDALSPSEVIDDPAAEEPEAADPSADPETDKAGNEAAKYRRQLRAAEAERDALATRLEAAHRREVERIAADHLADPADLWALNFDLEPMLGDDGNVDPEKVIEVTAALVDKSPHLARPSVQIEGTDDLLLSLGQGIPFGRTDSASWQKLMKPGGR